MGLLRKAQRFLGKRHLKLLKLWALWGFPGRVKWDHLPEPRWREISLKDEED